MTLNTQNETQKEKNSVHNSIRTAIQKYGHTFVDSQKFGDTMNSGIVFSESLVDAAKTTLKVESELQFQKKFTWNLKQFVSKTDNFLTVETSRMNSMDAVLDRITDSGAKLNQRKQRQMMEKVKEIQAIRKKNAQRILIMMASDAFTDGQIVSSIVEQNREILGAIKQSFGIHGSIVPRRETIFLAIQKLRRRMKMNALMNM